MNTLLYQAEVLDFPHILKARTSYRNSIPPWGMKPLPAVGFILTNGKLISLLDAVCTWLRHSLQLSQGRIWILSRQICWTSRCLSRWRFIKQQLRLRQQRNASHLSPFLRVDGPGLAPSRQTQNFFLPALSSQQLLLDKSALSPAQTQNHHEGLNNIITFGASCRVAKPF